MTTPDEPVEAGGPREGSGEGIPDPLDRLWRHPSEVADGGRSQSVPRRRRRRTVSNLSIAVLAAAAAAVGSVATVGLLAAVGVLDRDRVTITSNEPTTSPNTDALGTATAAVRRAVVAIAARDDSGLRRGAGICVRHGSDILTTSAVVGTAKAVTVTTADGSNISGTVVGVDAPSGLALVHVDRDVPTAQLAARAPHAGQSVYVVGRSGWLDDGRVNATNSTLTSAEGVTMDGLLATSVRIDSLGRGSALVDRRGSIAGIVLTNQGTAVPVAYASRVADELRRLGRVARAWAGIAGTDAKRGAVISGVTADGPAAKAGIRRGDLIISVDGRLVAKMGEVMAIVHAHWPGDRLTFAVQRDGRRTEIEIATIAPSRP